MSMLINLLCSNPFGVWSRNAEVQVIHFFLMQTLHELGLLILPVGLQCLPWFQESVAIPF